MAERERLTPQKLQELLQEGQDLREAFEVDNGKRHPLNTRIARAKFAAQRGLEKEPILDLGEGEG